MLDVTTQSSGTQFGATLMRERAALLGAFDPHTLLAGIANKGDVKDAFRALAKDCEEVSTVDGKFAWRMKPDPRRSTLTLMQKQGRLESDARAFEQTHAAILDEFAKSLIDGVLARSSSPVGNDTHLDARYAAAHFVDEIQNTRSASDVAAEIERQTRTAAIEFVRPNNLIGRDNELNRIFDFVRHASTEAPLFVTGVGGSGKSALMAEFVYRFSNEQSTRQVVWLDFDNAALRFLDETALTVEFARQLAASTDAHEDLRRFVATARALRDEQGSEVGNYQRSALLQTHIWSLWHDLVLPHIDLDSPTVLVLDTFEEVLMRGPDAMPIINRWISTLAGDGGIANLRCIVSGRVAPEAWGSQQAPHTLEALVIGDLETSSALALLNTLLPGTKIGQATLQSLIEKFGGNPLLLKLLARVLADDNDVSLIDLQGAESEHKLEGALAQGFLYRRILDRMREPDEDVRRIAHPGLVLRRVTPALIRTVLAEPCGLGEVSVVRSEELFNKLAGQVWLVESGPSPISLYHRRDLRRLMLQIMTSDDRAKALSIHSHARDYYSAHLDSTLASSDQDLEAAYHGLFLGDLNVSSQSLAEELIKSMGGDITCIDKHTQAKLKATAFQYLTNEERALLGEMELERVDTQHAQNMLSAGLTGSVDLVFDKIAPPTGFDQLSIVQSWNTMATPSTSTSPTQSAGVSLSRRSSPDSLHTFIETAFSQCEFNAVVGAGPDCVGAFFSGESAQVRDPSAAFVINTGMWRLLLSAIATERLGEVKGMVFDSIANLGHQIPWQKPINRFRESIPLSSAANLAFHVLAVDPSELSLALEFASQQSARTTEDLRGLQIESFRGILSSGADVRLGLLPYASKSFWAFLANAADAGPERPGRGSRVSIWQLVTSARSGKIPSADSTSIILPPSPNIFGAKALGVGKMPELYPPYRWALQDLDADWLYAFAVNSASRIDAIASEFRLWEAPNVWKDLMRLGPKGVDRDRARWVAAFVDAVDSAGRLRDLAVQVGAIEANSRIWKQLQLLNHDYSSKFSQSDVP